MKRLWTPWRMKYLESKRPKGCVFCNIVESDADAENYVLHRGERAFVVLNRYPYNSGHMMVIPYVHADHPADLDIETQTEMMSLVNMGLEVLKKAISPEGYNIGVNLGRAAGAGIDEHMHVHIVPRWQGDTNYMATCADTRIVPELLEDTHKKLKPIFDEVAG